MSKNITFLGLVAILGISNSVSAETLCRGLENKLCASDNSCKWVKPYTRSNGKEIQGYCRTNGKKLVDIIVSKNEVGRFTKPPK